MNSFKFYIAIPLLLVATGLQAESKAIKKELDKASVSAVTVYRSPTCSCCEKWVAHIKDKGFQVTDIVTEDVQGIKNKYGVTAEMASCHTALVDGYIVEGHVPADDIKQLLKTKPNVLGIAAPGMPVGTPGMEMGARKDAYQVMSFDDKKGYKVFHDYPAN